MINFKHSYHNALLSPLSLNEVGILLKWQESHDMFEVLDCDQVRRLPVCHMFETHPPDQPSDKLVDCSPCWPRTGTVPGRLKRRCLVPSKRTIEECHDHSLLIQRINIIYLAFLIYLDMLVVVLFQQLFVLCVDAKAKVWAGYNVTPVSSYCNLLSSLKKKNIHTILNINGKQ